MTTKQADGWIMRLAGAALVICAAMVFAGCVSKEAQIHRQYAARDFKRESNETTGGLETLAEYWRAKYATVQVKGNREKYDAAKAATSRLTDPREVQDKTEKYVMKYLVNLDALMEWDRTEAARIASKADEQRAHNEGPEVISAMADNEIEVVNRTKKMAVESGVRVATGLVEQWAAKNPLPNQPEPDPLPGDPTAPEAEPVLGE